MNLQVLETVRKRSGIPQAGGERVYGKYHYANLIKHDTYQIYQPDLGTCGGITEAMKIAAMADAVDTGIQIHVCGSPIAIAAVSYTHLDVYKRQVYNSRKLLLICHKLHSGV